MHHAAIILALALLSACATTGAVDKKAEQAASPAAETPAAPDVDLEALAVRELDALAKVPVRFPDDLFSAEVEASGEPSTHFEEGMLIIMVPLGTESQMVCYVYQEDIDTGVTVMNLAALVGETNKLVELRPVDVVAIDENPAMFVEMDYLHDSGQGLLAGRLKAMVFPHPAHPVMCLHDELGFSKSFERIALGFARSLSAKTDLVAARYGELQIIKVNGQPYGFTRMLVRDGAEGAAVYEWTGSRLVPSDDGMDAVDEAKSAISNAEGRLLGIGYAFLINGELALQAGANRKADNEYAFQGVKGGEPFSGTFQTKDPAGLCSDLLVAKLIRDELLGGKQSQLVLEEYLPSANPLGLTESVMRKGEDGPRSLSVEVGGATMLGRADERGFLESVEMRMPNVTVVWERAFARGQP
ncbi:MAG: hypothetical protein ACOX6T_04890 [Myxococcales bacterium]|jgi:hypothetical protein